jgi:hypothetical protein
MRGVKRSWRRSSSRVSQPSPSAVPGILGCDLGQPVVHTDLPLLLKGIGLWSVDRKSIGKTSGFSANQPRLASEEVIRLKRSSPHVSPGSGLIRHSMNSRTSTFYKCTSMYIRRGTKKKLSPARRDLAWPSARWAQRRPWPLGSLRHGCPRPRPAAGTVFPVAPLPPSEADPIPGSRSLTRFDGRSRPDEPQVPAAAPHIPEQPRLDQGPSCPQAGSKPSACDSTKADAPLFMSGMWSRRRAKARRSGWPCACLRGGAPR